MARGGKDVCKSNGRRNFQFTRKGSDESDEDYTFDEDEEFDVSEDGYSSFIGDESDDSLGAYYEDDEEELETKKVKKLVQSRAPRMKNNCTANPRKRKRVSYREVDDEDDEEEDYDDEEFTPDDLDEEEELPIMKNSTKSWLRKDTAKDQKRNRNHKVMKTTRKKPQKKRRLKRKEISDNDEEFVDVNPVMEENSNKNTGEGRRKRRFRVDSDSDFVGFGSSDHEFTISEEEGEQVEEASEFCKALTTSWRGSTSLKKSPKEEAPRVQRKHPVRKDKEKVEELKTEAGKQVCGICLSEEGKRTVRGTLNCCSHYFCFACIMEWSKVESRCPLCKQRFLTISKPAKSNTGFDLRTVVFQVPERDQVYQPSEEELRGYLDPYENVLCTECQHGGDDAFMLLCDLCDSPAHSYCVGLGREVPEGNWYCEGCRPTALVSSSPQHLNPTPDNRTSSNFALASPPVANVRETFDLNLIPETPFSQEYGDFQSPRDSQVASLAGAGAVTVSDRRRIQRQIHQLLNNRWREVDNGLSGTLGAVSGNSLFGSQIGRLRELATQPAHAHRDTYFHGRQLESNTLLSQNRIILPERSSYLSGQLNQPSTSSQSFFAEFLESECRGRDASINLGLIHPQLHPYCSRSNMGTDTSMSICPFTETMSLQYLQGHYQAP